MERKTNLRLTASLCDEAVSTDELILEHGRHSAYPDTVAVRLKINGEPSELVFVKFDELRYALDVIEQEGLVHVTLEAK